MRYSCQSIALALLISTWGCKPADQPASLPKEESNPPAATTADHSNSADHGGTATEDVTSSPAEADDQAASGEADSGPALNAAANQAETDATVTQVVAVDDPEVVLLGSDELTAGIPGEGPLTEDQIRAWLDNPANHRVIDPELPLGLSAAAANIQHIDENPMTRAKIELGRQLYFDPRLSSDGSVSFASCHHPDEGFGRKTQFGVGVGGQEGNRNSPVSYNRIVSGPQFWDGRAASLEEQAGGPIANPIEMGNTHEKAIEVIKGIPGYQMQFASVFPDEEISIDSVTRAIATFERAIVTQPAPYDYYEIVRTVENSYGDELEDLKEEDPEFYAEYEAALKGSEGLSDSAKRGRDLFFSERSNCTACHAGANFTDEKYHNLGVGMEAENPDLGRFVVTNVEADKGAFKTPTLRNVIYSAPYMHDGSQETLEEVVDWYVKGGHPNPYLSDKMKKLDLNDQEKQDLVAFMREALTSSFPKIETDRLPQ